MPDDVFKDLLVVELAGVLAGPSVGMFFAELGARVVKIENRKTDGDITRKWKVGTEPPENAVSAYYSSVNFYKEVVMADLTNEEDREEVLGFIRHADIVIANYKLGSAEKLGMDYASLKKLNPGLIYGSVEGLGSGDNRAAFDVVLQAETGFISMTGTVDGDYAKMPVALIDLLAAHQLKEGILVGLIRKGTSGKGCLVRVSLLESGLASLANQATNWLMAGHLPQKMGTKHPNIAPYGDLFETGDGQKFVLSVGTEKQWLALADLFDIPKKYRGMSNDERVAKRAEIAIVCQKAFVKFPSDDLWKLLESKGIPYGRVLTVDEALSAPAAQNMIIEEMQEGVLKRGLKSVVFSIE
ncbi:MAG: CoA transferase [Saprospirales bacterium]|nr:MAG: CoA transferase [Saprospirales bacterium]